MGCSKSLALNKLQFLMKNITVTGQELHVLLTQRIAFRCVKRGQGQELQGWRLAALTSLLAGDEVAQATGPPATCAKERHVVPQHLTIPQQVHRHPQKSEGKMQAYLYKYKVQGRYKAGQYIALGPGKGGTQRSILKGIGERKGPWDGTARGKRDEVLAPWPWDEVYPSAAPGWTGREPGIWLSIIPPG